MIGMPNPDLIEQLKYRSVALEMTDEQLRNIGHLLREDDTCLTYVNVLKQREC